MGGGGGVKIEDMIAAVQAELDVQVDGRAGPETWAAIYRRVVPQRKPATVIPEIALVDARSERCISTLLPEVQPMAGPWCRRQRRTAFASA